MRFGISPIGWINDDMPALGAGTSWQQILTDAAAIGFAGVELGGSFPTDHDELRRGFAEARIAPIGQWYGCALLEQDVAAELSRLDPLLGRLAAIGAEVLVVAETSNAIHRTRGQPLSHAPRLAEAEWARWGERLTSLAETVRNRGFRFAYHYHLGTIVERRDDLLRLLANSGPAVGLTLDTGHAALAGIDPVELATRWPERIAHLHLKDVRRPVFAAVQARDGSFLDGVLAGMFAAPGDGGLDFAPLMRALAMSGYDGWAVIEAEQDPALAEPRAQATLGLATAQAATHAAGLAAA